MRRTALGSSLNRLRQNECYLSPIGASKRMRLPLILTLLHSVLQWMRNLFFKVYEWGICSVHLASFIALFRCGYRLKNIAGSCPKSRPMVIHKNRNFRRSHSYRNLQFVVGGVHADTLNYSMISRWSTKSKGGRESVEGDPHLWQPCKSMEFTKASIVATIIDEDQRLTLNRIPLQELKMKLSVLHGFLVCSHENKWNLISSWKKENLKKLQDPGYSYCERVITIDKLWIHHYNPKLECESEIWQQKGEQKHRKVRQQKLMGKVQLEVFFVDFSTHLISPAENSRRIL